jgi:hypothetical protein
MKNSYSILLLLILIVSIIFLIIGKDYIFIQQQEIKLPSYLTIREVDIKPIDVTDSFVDINITAYINHNGGYTNNASMLVRAINRDAGLLVNQNITIIPTIDSDKTITVYQNLRIDRDKNYEMRIFLYDNGSVIDNGIVNVQGLNSLTPEDKNNHIILDNIDFIIMGSSEGKISINPDIYLDNIGPDPIKNLTLIVKAIETDSNIMADKTSTDTGDIKSGSTIIRSVPLSVPNGYNYRVVVELWNGDILTNRWEKPVLLAPTKILPNQTQEKPINIEVSKFIREGAFPGVTAPTPSNVPTPAIRKESGFELYLAIFAFMIVIYVYNKKTRLK